MAHAEVSNGCGHEEQRAEAGEAGSVVFHAPTLARLVPKRLDVSDISHGKRLLNQIESNLSGKLVWALAELRR